MKRHIVEQVKLDEVNELIKKREDEGYILVTTNLHIYGCREAGKFFVALVFEKEE